MNQEDFSNYIVEVRGREHYGRFRHPDGLQKRLQEMAAFARANGIEVTFIVDPLVKGKLLNASWASQCSQFLFLMFQPAGRRDASDFRNSDQRIFVTDR